ncbi:thymidylate synthase [Pandoraea communis]|uniref:thymidylate synthase n=1 Tax=Pandoraea communis TaxID=2508297 RepID=A0A5E4RAA9_9BURK|nr:thymidylate synthase [Pandoraea communis]VVD60145.1 thymidylate synthase [Pandoraea communis]
MYLSADTLDDLLIRVYKRLLRRRGAAEINPSKGQATELNGVLLHIRQPRARLSRTERKGTFFSCLGEFLWYLSGTDEVAFIEYYIRGYDKFSDDGKTIFGAYGPRLFGQNGTNQVENVITTLKARPDSRRAVIQLFHGEDLAADIAARRKDIPCTCTLQFSIRSGRLHLLVMMRSNDAYMGLPHDVFAFTMLQEIVARSLKVELGSYKHAVGSLHLYATNTRDAEAYIEEGVQARVEMPPMPYGDPTPSIRKLLKAEQSIRAGRFPALGALDPYWADLARLLQVFRISKRRPTLENRKRVVRIKKEMHSDIYETYILKRELRMARHAESLEPLLFDKAELDAQQAPPSV